MIKIFKIISFIIFISFSFQSLLAKDIGPIEANKLYEENKIIIVDVRNKSEWEETGIIPGVHLVQMLNPIFKIRKNTNISFKPILDRELPKPFLVFL